MEKIYLKDYKPSDFQIPTTELHFDIQVDHTVVTTNLTVQKTNPQAIELFLDGEELTLEKLWINGQELPPSSYALGPKGLTLKNPPEQFELKTQVRIYPDRNTSLSGLYQSGTNLITQCEAQGFRRITFYLDRPDVMSTFKVRISADRKKFPQLLSNGDLIGSQINGDRQTVEWQDPHKKPCYLFALVAGNFGLIEDLFTTKDGRKVKLQIYSEPQKIDQCHYAMESLKKAMKWDEERFGLQYDLNTYMIVATDDFNAGAMENKGLNIFNSRLVIASPKTATDQRFEAIESVIAHEYFHNWTGNRVTLRDWFHLSLKEGLTVFRDQEFSMDQISRDLVRIQNVVDLRESQFAEDQGPNAHPIRPDNCYSVDNFFTSTIYEKGAEVIRMMQTMVGRPGFRQGMDLYFKRHDGQAVIIEDFAQAIADANQIKPGEWDQFKLWYSQAGTPKVKVTENFDSERGYQLSLSQKTAPTPGQTEKQAFHIPLEIEFLDENGQELIIEHAALSRNTEGKQLLNFKNNSETLELKGLKVKPTLSLNRGFSAPIELDWERTDSELLFLFGKDTDPFNRWESGQKIYQSLFTGLLKSPKTPLKPELVVALKALLTDRRLPPALKAQMLSLPSINYLAQIVPGFEAESFQTAHHSLQKLIAQALENEFNETYLQLKKQDTAQIDPASRGLRSLKNRILGYLGWTKSGVGFAEEQYFQSQLMTDQEVALAILLQHSGEPAQRALNHYFETWKDDGLMLNSWWRLQASTETPETFKKVIALGDHPRFKLTNPNCVYMLYGAFGDNVTQFHRGDGSTYKYFCEKLSQVDRLNPMVAARIASSFDFCLKTDKNLQGKARENLKALVEQGLSSNTFEIVSKILSSLSR